MFDDMKSARADAAVRREENLSDAMKIHNPAAVATAKYGNPAMLNTAYRAGKKSDTAEGADIKEQVRRALEPSRSVPAGR